MLLINQESILNKFIPWSCHHSCNAKVVILSMGFCDVAEPIYLPIALSVDGWVPVPLPMARVAGQDCSTGTGTDHTAILPFRELKQPTAHCRN